MPPVDISGFFTTGPAGQVNGTVPEVFREYNFISKCCSCSPGTCNYFLADNTSIYLVGNTGYVDPSVWGVQ